MHLSERIKPCYVSVCIFRLSELLNINIECILSWLVFHKVCSLVVPNAQCCRLCDPDVQMSFQNNFFCQASSQFNQLPCLRHSCLFLANFMHRLPFLHTSLLLCPNLSMILALLLILASLMLHFLQYTNASGAILPPRQYSWLITSCPSWYPVFTFICLLPWHHCCYA